jgi:Mg-chelatase subunit ChlD
VFLGSLAAATLLRAQEQQDATFSADVKVVNILATVRDKKGQIMSNLGKDDFTVSEDGRPQTIKYFSRETDLPLTLGLLVDTSLSQRRVLGQERTASFRFLDRVLRADRDRTFVMHFDHESELLQDLTSSRTDLQRALDQLELPAQGQQQQSNRGTGNSGGGGGYPGGGGGGIGLGIPGIGIGMGGGRRGGGYPGGGNRQPQQRRASGPGTTMYDAIYLASNEILKKQQGRKAIILLTDGVDNGSKTFLNDAIEAAQRADTLAYSILFSDEAAYGQQGGLGGMNRRIGGGAQDHPDGKKVLERISKETGGTFYEVSKKLSIDDIFDRLQEELRNQYSIGYTPDQAASSSGFRAIKVATTDPHYIVQSREGYYPAAGSSR